MPHEIPERCTVLVVGGGPGGSYCAAALAREGIDTVLLEADRFPRYHIGESMLASMRHLLRFIDLDQTFDQYGFTKKVGAAFKLNKDKQPGYTDFLAAGGPENYAWNVVRSEADNLMFQHAAKCGAKTFDGVQVKSIEFASTDSNPGRPIAASYVHKDDESKETRVISFDYIVDASGRVGFLSTKYLKNRRYNQSLKNVAHWAYWTGAEKYAKGTARENSPFFEALQDESGWAWLIPLHNGTVSVGIVRNQQIASAKKTESGLDLEDFYLDTLLHQAPDIRGLLGDGKLTTAVKSASDYSYSASSYAVPHARIIGDAGCFIDPYFSSGVHLALVGGLSAAITISAALGGDCEETTAAAWHSAKIADSYTRFLLVVLSAYRQIRSQNEPVLSDFGEDNFDRAFAFFRPVIQGTADVHREKLTQDELNRTMEFCANAFEPARPEVRSTVLQKLRAGSEPGDTTFHPDMSPEEERVVKHICARQMMRTEDTMNISSFGTDVINGFLPNLCHGSLGLVRSEV
ncbi:FAD/NAD(P)-binding domain-containing protein [Aspergillus ellipticus CBS 707.79]|uniref:FAD/NAD(P)-binding domain-containing protein n=1 Tax=Aspergillus ellipticus CBS 707.79 TaxID=1448320 RepID=A0A319DFD0_9EURO|nr:FAD/NAD(P)-binding domain-containing protein [Aspergillus ellipticus CBS 707.79]